MPIHTRSLFAAVLAALLAACAGTPAAETEAPKAAAPAAAGARANPYPGTTMRDGPDGMTLYCRKEVPTGERIPRELCYTEHAMRALAEGQKDRAERMRENSGYASGGT